MKRGTPRHPKTKKLSRELKIPIAHAVGILEMLWHFTAEFCPMGDIGRMDDVTILESFGESPDNSRILQTLIDIGWIDRSQEHRLVIHDWHEHCDDYTKKKVKRKGLKYVSEDVQTSLDYSGLSRQSPENSGKKTPALATATATTSLASALATAAPPMRFDQWPKTLEAVCGRFPTADVVLVGKIIQASLQIHISIDNPKCPSPTDSVLAEAVKLAADQANGQTSPGLFLKNVPAVISNWAKFGRNGATPHVDPKEWEVITREDGSQVAVQKKTGKEKT
jgi:hypothetical protein